MAANRVMVVISLRRWGAVVSDVRTQADVAAGGGGRPAPVVRCVLGMPPPAPSSPLELLRVQLTVPPAVKQANAEKVLRAAVRKSAWRLHLSVPPAGQLRQVQASEGSVFALLGVPKEEARQWLRSSGAGGLLVRPFWVPDSRSSLQRSDYEICWLKNCPVDAATLWELLWEQYGFFGLVSNGKGLGLRVAPGVDTDGMLAQVHFATKDVAASIRRPVLGARWWRLGPLTDAEVWHASEMVAAFGLQPLRGELRFGRLGPFRSVVYFTAVGTPARYSLDDGSWSASAAQLSPASPPPPRPKRSSGSALSPQSVWAGPQAASPLDTSPVGSSEPAVQLPPRSLLPASSASSIPYNSLPLASSRSNVPIIPASSSQPAPVPSRTTVWVPPASSPSPDHGRSSPAAWPPLNASSSTAQPLAAAGQIPRGQRRGGRGSRESDAARGAGPVVPGTLGAATPDMTQQLAALVAQIAALTEEVRELRKENARLQQQLELTRGPTPPQLYRHQPYTVSPRGPTTPLCPIPVPSFPPLPPSPGDTVMDTTNLGSRERELGSTPEAKRPSLAARALKMPGSAAVMDVDSESEVLVPDPQRVRQEAPATHV